MVLSGNAKKDAAKFKSQFKNSFDISERRFVTKNGISIFVFYVDGLVAKDMINESIIAPLLEITFRVNLERRKIENAEDIQHQIISASDLRLDGDLESITLKVLSGDTAIFVDGSAEAIVAQTRSWINRGIQKPETGQTVRGPKESFTETLLFNTSLIRRRLKTPLLKTEILTIGRKSATSVCMMYVEGVAKKELVDELRQRLSSISAEYILESGHIEQLIEDNKSSLFATTGNTERPDVAAAKLMKGRVVIIVDGSPFVLTVPMLFVENFQSAEDYYTRPFYSNFLRVLRVTSYIAALALPALYVALAVFHHEMIPIKLLRTLIESREGVPFTTAAEMVFMLVLYELLREALLRLPATVGSTVGIVGALIIGDAAVSTGIISSPVVVISALTFITSAVANPTTDSTAILRFLLIGLGAALGLFGVIAGLIALMAHLCSLESYGMPYMFPIAPSTKRGFTDSVIRGNIRKIVGVKK